MFIMGFDKEIKLRYPNFFFIQKENFRILQFDKDKIENFLFKRCRRKIRGAKRNPFE